MNHFIIEDFKPFYFVDWIRYYFILVKLYCTIWYGKNIISCGQWIYFTKVLG